MWDYHSSWVNDMTKTGWRSRVDIVQGWWADRRESDCHRGMSMTLTVLLVVAIVSSVNTGCKEVPFLKYFNINDARTKSTVLVLSKTDFKSSAQRDSSDFLQWFYEVFIQSQCISHSSWRSACPQFGEANWSMELNMEAQQCTAVDDFSGKISG